MTFFIGFFCSTDHFFGIEQFQIQGAGNVRVVQPNLSLPHRILVLAKGGQSMLNEAVKSFKGLRACDGPAKAVQSARVCSQLLIDQVHHLLCDAVRFKSQGFGQQAWACFSKTAAVFFVKVPLTADGFFAVHQDASFLTQLSVEKFLAQLFAALGVFCKVTNGAKEVRVIPNVQCQVIIFSNGSQAL